VYGFNLDATVTAASVCVCVFSLTRLSLLLLVLHYTVEVIFHTSRLLYFSEKAEIANYGHVVGFSLC